LHVALLTLLISDTYTTRNVLASVLVMVWAARLAGIQDIFTLICSCVFKILVVGLSGFLLFRVLKTGSDTRFDEIRSHFFKFLGFWVGELIFRVFSSNNIRLKLNSTLTLGQIVWVG
jgi:steroid 5-alpha reductase family enzyme